MHTHTHVTHTYTHTHTHTHARAHTHTHKDKLGDVVFVELPDVDSDLEKGDQLGTLESVKAVAEVYTAVSGKVTEVNSELENSPNLVNEDPLGNGEYTIQPLVQNYCNSGISSSLSLLFPFPISPFFPQDGWPS